MTWADVEAAVKDAKSIAYDGCHKIYVLMDDEQTEEMRTYGYGDDGSSLIIFEPSAYDDMMAILHEWWDDSCGLRFINGVRTVDGNPNDGFTRLIAQGEDNP